METNLQGWLWRVTNAHRSVGLCLEYSEFSISITFRSLVRVCEVLLGRSIRKCTHPNEPLPSSHPPSRWQVRQQLSVPHTRFSATVAGRGRRLVRTGFLWVAVPNAEQAHGLHRTELCGALVISRGAPHPTGCLEVQPSQGHLGIAGNHQDRELM